jgi:hypothetical protein
MTEDKFVSIQMERIIEDDQKDMYCNTIECNVMFNKLMSRGYAPSDMPNICPLDGSLTYVFKKKYFHTKKENDVLLFIINAKRGLTKGFRLVKLKNYLPF